MPKEHNLNVKFVVKMFLKGFILKESFKYIPYHINTKVTIMKKKDLIFNRNYILLSLFILMFPLITAATETYKVNEDVNLNFICTLNNAIAGPTATYNITVTYPNGTIFINNLETTPLGSGAFSYQTRFTETGLYKVQMFCRDGTYSFSDEGFYDVTPTGKIQTSIWDNPLLLILGCFGLILVIYGVSGGVPWAGFLGSIMFLLIGIYTMIYGFNNTTDLYTQWVAITLIGLGIIFMFASAYEWFYIEKDEED